MGTASSAGAKTAQRQRECARLMAEYVLSCAGDLARQGRYSAAEELLGTLADSEPGDGSVSDLLARIRIRQGRVAEARQLWLKALSDDPGNVEYRSAVTYIDRHKHPLRRPVITLAVGGFVCVAALIAGALYYGLRGESRAKAPPAPPHSEERREAGELSCLEHLRSSGAKVELAAGEGVRISFPAGLFSNGARLNPSGRSGLTRLGEALRECGTGLDIHLMGQADGVPVRSDSQYVDNLELSLMRAAVAYGVIRRGAPNLRKVHVSGDVAGGSGSKRDPALRTVSIVVKPVVPR